MQLTQTQVDSLHRIPIIVAIGPLEYDKVSTNYPPRLYDIFAKCDPPWKAVANVLPPRTH